VNPLFTVITQQLTPVLRRFLVLKGKKEIRKDNGWFDAAKDEIKGMFYFM
jgi:hypothetical protein